MSIKTIENGISVHCNVDYSALFGINLNMDIAVVSNSSNILSVYRFHVPEILFIIDMNSLTRVAATIISVFLCFMSVKCLANGWQID